MQLWPSDMCHFCSSDGRVLGCNIWVEAFLSVPLLICTFSLNWNLFCCLTLRSSLDHKSWIKGEQHAKEHKKQNESKCDGAERCQTNKCTLTVTNRWRHRVSYFGFWQEQIVWTQQVTRSWWQRKEKKTRQQLMLENKVSAHAIFQTQKDHCEAPALTNQPWMPNHSTQEEERLANNTKGACLSAHIIKDNNALIKLSHLLNVAMKLVSRNESDDILLLLLCCQSFTHHASKRIDQCL